MKLSKNEKREKIKERIEVWPRPNLDHASFYEGEALIHAVNGTERYKKMILYRKRP